MREYDETTHANVHRGVYAIAEEATRRFEAARRKVGAFIGAPDPAREVIFAKNATEGLNLVAHAWGRTNLRAGDAIVLTEMEHHANIVPWHMLAEERGVTIRWIPVDDDGRLELDDLDQLVDGAKLVGVTCMSNVLGTVNPISDHRRGGPRRRGRRGGRRGAVGPPPPHRCVRPRRRLPGLQRPQDGRADRHRRAVGTGRAVERASAVPRRGRDDPRRAQGRLHAQRHPLAVRGGHAADHRGHRLRGGRRLPVRHRDGGHRGPRSGADRLRHGRTDGAVRRRPHPLRPPGHQRTGAASCRSPTGASIPTTSPRSSTSTAYASGPATTAPSR